MPEHFGKAISDFKSLILRQVNHCVHFQAFYNVLVSFCAAVILVLGLIVLQQIFVVNLTIYIVTSTDRMMITCYLTIMVI